MEALDFGRVDAGDNFHLGLAVDLRDDHPGEVVFVESRLDADEAVGLELAALRVFGGEQLVVVFDLDGLKLAGDDAADPIEGRLDGRD